MPIIFADANRPKAYPYVNGTKKSYADPAVAGPVTNTRPEGTDQREQLKELEIHSAEDATPKEYRDSKIEWVRDGAEINKVGLQSYTRPDTVTPAPDSV